jgi:hypothetical protein
MEKGIDPIQQVPSNELVAMQWIDIIDKLHPPSSSLRNISSTDLDSWITTRSKCLGILSTV